jgi:hypothetical protein
MRDQLVIQTDRVYTIQRTPQGVVCMVNDKPLPLRLDAASCVTFRCELNSAGGEFRGSSRRPRAAPMPKARELPLRSPYHH